MTDPTFTIPRPTIGGDPDLFTLLVSRMGFSPYDPELPARNGVSLDDYRRLLEELQERRDLTNAEKILKLPAIKAVGVLKRSVPQPSFKPEFDTTEQISLRIYNTLITVGDELYFVQNIHPSKNEGKQDFLLEVTDHRGKTYHVWYSDPRVDLRAPEPQYVRYNGRPAFYTRTARRQQQQGLCRGNTTLKYVGDDRFYNADNIYDIAASFRYRDNLMWDTYLERLFYTRALGAIRLSEKVAVWMDEDAPHIEYRGRPLGELRDDQVYCDPADIRPWIKNHVALVGLKLKEKPRD